MMSTLLRLSLIAGCLCFVGCGAPGDLSGAVTFDGKPLAAGSVILVASDASTQTANVEEGRYAFVKIPPGPSRLAVVCLKPLDAKPAPETNSRLKGPARPAAGKWVSLPDRYKDPTTSGFTFDIRPGDNKFDLTLTK